MKFLSNILVKAGLIVDGSTTLNTIANATTDTDKFLVSDAGVVKYRTGSEVLSDIGAQGSLTLTTTGSSGAATLVGNTLNIPQYAGTVTSVAMTVPTGLQVGGSPIISSGTLALTFQSGYSIPTNVKQGNWDDAYTWVSNFPTQTGNNGKYLTTDGNTLSWGTINISGYVPTSRSLTINGTAYDLSLDRSWSVGTITSITGGTGLTGGTITSSGTLAFDTTWGDARYQQLLTNPVTGSGTAGQVAYFTGSNSVGGSSTFTFSPTAQLLLNNSVTAAGAIARGQNITSSLTAAANNDVLVGLDIAPTFTNGAFTGVTNLGLRVTGNSIFSRNLNSNTFITISNTTAGNLSQATLGLVSDASAGSATFRKNSSTTGVYKILTVSSAQIYNETAGDIAILNDVATGTIKMAAGASSTSQMQIFANGNVGINQNTDAGFRLDVNGTARVQGTATFLDGLRINGGFTSFNASTIFGSSAQSGNTFNFNTQYAGAATGATNYFNFTGTLASQTGGLFVFFNMAQTLSNANSAQTYRGFYYNPTVTGLVANTSHIAFENTSGNVLLGTTSGNVAIGTSTLGTATELTLGGSQTASSSIARGQLLNTTLVAAANNDVLVGLDINPTFTNGAFTGVTNYGIRSFLNLSGIYDGLQIRNTAAGANAQSRIKFDNDITPTQTSTGAVIFYTSSVFSGFPSNTLGFYNYNSTGALAFGTNAGERMRMFSTGNVLIQNGGTFTDAGFRLDVNGTARVQGTTTISGDNNLIFQRATDGNSLLGVELRNSGGNERGAFKINMSTGEVRIGATNGGGFFPTFFTNGVEGGRFTGAGTFQTSASVTAASAIARGVNFTNTLVAAANNDFLVGLDINPTFTNGAFTGVNNVGLRVNFPNSGANNVATFRTGTNNNANLTSIQLVNSASGLSSIVNLVSGNVDNGNPYFAIQNRNNAGTVNENFRIFQSGNVVIQNGGTFTDAGFRLDVNGTARVQGALTVVPANNTTGFSISGSSLTGSNAQSLVSLSQTWNTTGNPTAISLNITNTASGATSNLIDLQVGAATRFQVSGAGRARLGAYGSGTITGTATYNLAVDASGNVIEVTGGGGGGIGGSGTTNYLPKFTATSTLGNSQIFDNGTNVGINTATPNEKLEVSGILRVSRTTSASVYLNVTAESGNIIFDARGSSDQIFHTQTLERLRIGLGGDITISTINNATIDTDKFLVSDSGVIKYRTGSEILSDIGGQGALTLTTTGTSGAATLVGNTLNIPQYSGGGGSVSGTTNYIAKFTSSTAVGDSQLFDNGTNVGVATATAGSKLQVNGNAAIGYSASTAAPTNGLAVSGNLNVGTTTSVSKVNVSDKLRLWDATPTGASISNVMGYMFNTSSVPAGSFVEDVGTGIILSYGVNTPQAGTRTTSVVGGIFRLDTRSTQQEFTVIGLATGGSTEAQRIGINLQNGNTILAPAAGNVGVGISAYGTMGSKLQVNGNAAIGYSASTAAPTNGLAVAGNVGIGIAAPATNLHVYRTTAGLSGMQISNLTHGSTVTDGMFVGVDDTQGYIYMYENLPIQLSTNSTVRLFINNDGTVFVGGTNAPASPTTGILSGSGATGTNVAGAELRIRGGASTGNAAGGAITFFTSAAGTSGTTVNAAAERMRITSTGITMPGGVTYLLFNFNNAQAASRSWRMSNDQVVFGDFTIQQSTTQTGSAYNNIIYSDASGNIGLNTTTVGSRLQVNGGAAIGYSASTAAPTNGLAVSGNVGIGTTTIGSRLQVNGGAAIGYSASTAAPTNGLIVAGNAYFGGQIAALTDVMQLRGTGNVIIAMQSTVNTQFSGMNLYNETGTLAGSFALGNSGTGSFSNNFFLGPRTASGNLLFVTGASGTTRMTMTNNGELQFTPAANTSVLSTTGAYSLTGANAQSLIDLAGTWNTTGNPTAIKLNITNTASGANSLLMDLQVGGTPEFRVTRTGNVVVNGSTSTYQMHVVGTGSLLALGEESFTTGRQMLFGIDGSGNGEIQSVHQGTSYRNLALNPLGGNVGIATSSPTSTLHANGSVAKAITTKTATYTLTSSDHTVIFNLNGNATANLPDATTCTGRIYMIKINRTNTTDTLTIDPNGTQTIDGFTTYALQCQYAVIIQSDGSNWQILGDFANGTNCL